ncbi:MAG: AIR synthase family protein [Candidatus Bathyarchaeia archaeon]|jgi:hydrogenase maturation factor
MTLPPGKIPVDILKDIVFRNLGAPRSEIVLGPSAGVDGAVINVGNVSLISSMDPITGAADQIGWLAVNVNANDVATFGCEPRFLLSCIMLPEKSTRTTVETITKQMSTAAEDLGIAIVGGHCETTPSLKTPIVVGCAMGTTEKNNYVTAADAKQGDKLILTKSAGIEGTAILASDRHTQLRKALDKKLLKNAKQFRGRISIVKDALTAFRTGGVHAMHDPTEGGVAGAIHEMADASNLGVKIYRKKIRIEPETASICDFYQIDPLQLIASGSLLIAADPASAEKIAETLRRNLIPAEIIGEFLPSSEKRLLIQENGKTETLTRPETDQLWQALKRSPTH